MTVTSVPAPPARVSAGSPIVLTLSCLQAPGIVRAVTGFLYERGFNIQEHHQFDDAHLDAFHLRTSFSGTEEIDMARLESEFAEVAAGFDMDFEFASSTPPRILVMVSKSGHCLNDLLFRWRGGTLGGEIVAVVSNHEDLRQMAEAAGLPYIVVPVTAETRSSAEDHLRGLVDEYEADLVVLARYMQVLSDELCCDLAGRAINIHHSFLPGFKGGRPYHQAYDRGVKLIGATAHYVTGDLDEGPIIEQDVQRVNHAADPRTMATLGQDIEALVLSRAVRWHCERRVLVRGHRTIVFN